MKNYLIKSTYISLIIIFTFVQPAYASYIDPSTGGMLFQVLAVLFGVISGVILLFSSRIKMALFRIMRYFRESDTINELEENPDD